MQSTLEWLQGGALNGCFPAGLLVGDRLLIAVRVRRSTDSKSQAWSGPSSWWEYEVIVVAEVGFDTTDGETWGAWDWDDVSWYAKLDGLTLPERITP